MGEESLSLEGLSWGDGVMGKQGGEGGGGHAAKAGIQGLVLFPEVDGRSLGIFGFDGFIGTEGKS